MITLVLSFIMGYFWHFISSRIFIYPCLLLLEVQIFLLLLLIQLNLHVDFKPVTADFATLQHRLSLSVQAEPAAAHSSSVVHKARLHLFLWQPSYFIHIAHCRPSSFPQPLPHCVPGEGSTGRAVQCERLTHNMKV